MEEYDRRSRLYFVDTNVIFESYKLNIWKAVTKNYNICTVEKVIEESIKRPRDRSKLLINEKALRKSLYDIKAVSRESRAELAVKYEYSRDLDEGEEYLIAYLLTEDENTYYCCTADFAAIRAGVNLRLRHNFISLEELALDIGIKRKFRSQYTKKILSQKKTEFLLEKGNL